MRVVALSAGQVAVILIGTFYYQRGLNRVAFVLLLGRPRL